MRSDRLCQDVELARGVNVAPQFLRPLRNVCLGDFWYLRNRIYDGKSIGWVDQVSKRAHVGVKFGIAVTDGVRALRPVSPDSQSDVRSSCTPHSGRAPNPRPSRGPDPHGRRRGAIANHSSSIHYRSPGPPNPGIQGMASLQYQCQAQFGPQTLDAILLGNSIGQ